jgi:hypothetical protein
MTPIPISLCPSPRHECCRPAVSLVFGHTVLELCFPVLSRPATSIGRWIFQREDIFRERPIGIGAGKNWIHNCKSLCVATDFLPLAPGPRPFHSGARDGLLAQARPHIPQVFVGLGERGGVDLIHGRFRVFFDQQDSTLDEGQIIHRGPASVSV